MAKAPLEKELEREALIWLNRVGFLAVKLKTMGTYDAKARCHRRNFNPFVRRGIPDILAIWKMDGRAVLAECKRLGMKRNISEDQLVFLLEVKEANAIAIVFDSMDDLKSQLREQLNEHCERFV